VSEHVTWEVCPYCGLLAAVGWASAGVSEAPAGNRPVEFDCRTGCQVSPDEFAEISRRAGSSRRQPTLSDT
jgi:hypothetical protein